MISFFSKKKLNLLYIILPVCGILIAAVILALRLDTIWMLTFNPGLLLVFIFGMFIDEYNTRPEFDGVIVIFAYLIFWIPATYVTIKIIDIIRNKLKKRRSKTAVP